MIVVTFRNRTPLYVRGPEVNGKPTPEHLTGANGNMKYFIPGSSIRGMVRSIVEGGSSGIDCSRSRMSVRTGIGELSAVYQVRIPVPLFQIPLVRYEETMRIKGWTGYERAGFGGEDDETVYITETGLVYHKDYHCTHLDLSIRMASGEEVSSLRNESGGKYYACEHCGGGSGGAVYITLYGDRYHSSLSCSGLKRTVYAVPLSEAVGKGACSKCGH